MPGSGEAQITVDAAAFQNMLDRLGSEIKNLHASHEQLLALVAGSGSIPKAAVTVHSLDVLIQGPDKLTEQVPPNGPEDQWTLMDRAIQLRNKIPENRLPERQTSHESYSSRLSPARSLSQESFGSARSPCQVGKAKRKNLRKAPGSPIRSVLPKPKADLADLDEDTPLDALQLDEDIPRTMSKMSGYSSGKRGECLDRQGNRIKQELIAIFNQLDVGSTGSLDRTQLRSALINAGLPPVRLQGLLALADPMNTGMVAADLWTGAVMTAEDKEMHRLSFCLRERLDRDGGLLQVTDEIGSCMMHPLSVTRVCWDCLITAACLYIAVCMPFTTVWTDLISGDIGASLTIADRAINYFFIIDIIINFRTGYVNEDGELTMHWKRVAGKYLRTWFLFDVISSLPTDEIPDSNLEQLQVIKVLKLSKLLKVLRIMRPRNVDLSEFSDHLDDIAQSKVVQLVVRKSRLFFYMIFLCHWMACGMKFADTDSGWLSSLDNVAGDLLSEYLTAQYWAMMTLTTVGYGDIVPSSNEERAYATVAMVIGACFYGYVVGAITSLVSKSDLNASTYHERMDLIYAWLNHHHLPIAMKRTLRRYFKAYLMEQSAVSESTVFQDLSHELQMEVGEFLIHEDVKNNPLFDGVSIGCVVQLQSIMKRVTIQAGYFVTIGGEMGIAMYVLVAGAVELIAWSQEEAEELATNGFSARSQKSALDRSSSFPARRMSQSSSTIRELSSGESFGEEILLGFREHYEYTTKALEKSKLEMIPQGDFLKIFQMLPNVLERIRRNCLAANPGWRQITEPNSPTW